MPFKRLATIPRAYANVLFVDHLWVGLLIIIATLWFPNVGIAGLLGALTGLLATRWLHFHDAKDGLHIYNSLLVGLSLGAFYELNSYVVVLIVLGSVLAVMLTVVFTNSLWRLDRLPALSLPFIFVVLITAPVARRYSSLSDFLGLAEAQHQLTIPWLDGFFSSLGSIFFSPQPIVGLLLFLGIFWRSRYLALLAIAGYGFGYVVFNLLTENPHPSLVVWTGFNFALTAMAIAGFYTVPGIAGALLAFVAVAISAMLIVATQDFLMIYGLPVMAIPFVVTTLVVLSALQKRESLVRPWVAPQPGLPEANYDRARLAQVRNGEFNSVPLLPPFYGEWEIYQGFDGPHTHKGEWRHALDFYLTEHGKSFDNQGQNLTDYFCFGLPVISPAHGKVVRAMDALVDNAPGEVDVRNNWGNFILLRLENGLHILLAHLRQHSIKVAEGDYVTPGMQLAACGNSGRSPQPHVHLQVQRDATLGSPTHPFHLTSVLVRSPEDQLEYRLVARPEAGTSVLGVEQDEQLSAQLHLPVGRTLRYALTEPGGEQSVEVELHVELTLLGQFRLVSDTGASAAFEETNGVLAFYDRQGPADSLLDSWMLANGLTPLTALARHWQDSPSASLLPLTPLQRAWLWVWHPLGCGTSTQYRRQWDHDAGMWLQSGEHRLQIGAHELLATSQSTLDPVFGCVRIDLQLEERQWQATLVDTGQVSDRGIPGWNEETSQVTDTKSDVNVSGLTDEPSNKHVMNGIIAR
jgi:urea transporter